MRKVLQPKPSKQSVSFNSGVTSSSTVTVYIPYVKGTSENIKRVMKSYGIKTWVKPKRKLKQNLCKPKDRLEPGQACSLIYKMAVGGW